MWDIQLRNKWENSGCLGEDRGAESSYEGLLQLSPLNLGLAMNGTSTAGVASALPCPHLGQSPHPAQGLPKTGSVVEDKLGGEGGWEVACTGWGGKAAPASGMGFSWLPASSLEPCHPHSLSQAIKLSAGVVLD